MEYIQLGDLEKNIKVHSGRVSEIEARDITEQILSGLEIMHAESFAHRDLKPQVITMIIAIIKNLLLIFAYYRMFW